MAKQKAKRVVEKKVKQVSRGFSDLKTDILSMGKMVEGMVKKAIQGMVEQKNSFAKQVIDEDQKVDQFEIQIDNFCIDLFSRGTARRAPTLTPHEIRSVACGMKIVADLERIGDLAVDISQMVLELNQQPALKPYVTLPKMTDIVERMVEDSLRSYVKEEATRAYQVIRRQEEIEGYSRDVFNELVEFMSRDIFSIYRSTRLLGITRYLERIGAHAANIAEMVVLMVKGEDIRHQHGRM